jgi:uncharacterized membrane protein YdjX (TVP38/TMEM64 family)
MRARNKALLYAIIFVFLLFAILIFPNPFIKIFSTPSSIRNSLSFGETLNPFYFILLYSLASILFIPITYLTINSGTVFGSFLGTIYSSLAIVLASIVSFGISRFLLKSFFENLIHERFETAYSLDLQLKKKGTLSIFILRILPIPFNLVNIFAGITKIRFRDFLIATLIWVVPETFLFSYLGSFLFEIKVLKLILFFLLLITLYLIHSKIKKNSSISKKNTSK